MPTGSMTSRFISDSAFPAEQSWITGESVVLCKVGFFGEIVERNIVLQTEIQGAEKGLPLIIETRQVEVVT